MSTTIQRPSFFFGQYLGPEDLQAGLDHARGQMARHERYLHTWGIAQGLDLIETGKQTAKGKEYLLLSVRSGVAVDGFGREIVVPENEALDTSRFQQLSVFVKDAWHPVVLRAVEQAEEPQGLSPGGCGETQPKRITEAFEVTFLRPGEEGDTQTPPTDVSLGAPSPSSDEPWNVLLGFVKWDADLKQFTAFTASNKGIGPRYAGVLADEVIARSGKLVLRSKGVETNDVPALMLNASDPTEFLTFGKQTDGNIQPLAKIDSDGNLWLAGAVSDSKKSVWVESGVLSDGMPVPLPQGVSEPQVTDGQLRVHIHVTPRMDTNLLAITPANTTAVPLECRVQGRIVFCRYAFMLHVAGAPTIAAGLCDYTIVVTPA